MLNPPGAKGRAVSSAGTPSQARQALEQRRQVGAWEPASPAPGTLPSRRCLRGALRTSRPLSCPESVGADTAPAWVRPALGAQLHLGAGWDIPRERSGAVGGRV